MTKIMVRFGETEIAKETFYGATKLNKCLGY